MSITTAGKRRYLLGCTAALAILSFPAHAQERMFRLKAGDAIDAIPAFAQQSGLQIVAPADRLGGVRTPALVGKFDARVALKKLLRNTSLVVASDDGAIIVLKDQKQLSMRSFPRVQLASNARLSLALAQDAPVATTPPPEPVEAPAPAPAESEPPAQDIIVTGSRIVRNGYQAPTPVAVINAEQLNSMATNNIAEAVNRLPSLTGSVRTTNSASADMTGGIQNMDLRGLSPTRTLVLLDGKRIVGSTLAGFDNNGGAVDVNAFPNGLISRVDVVTGGASAVYGSDALAGVVNFVLDKEFVGVKGSVQGGITNYGDDESYRLNLTLGTSFAGGRGHFLIAGENSYTRGILHKDRPWFDRSYSIITNPGYTATNGQPYYITAFDTGLSMATRGGLIVSPGPLRGTQFGAGGAPLPFNFGPVISGVLMQGGDWETSRIDKDGMMDLRLQRSNVFARGSYEITDNVKLYGEFLWSRTRSRSLSGVPQWHMGNLTIKSGNPFIPESIQAAMDDFGIQSFTLGTTNGDLPQFGHDNVRTVFRYVGGLEGTLGVLGTDWKWDGYYERSTTHVYATTPGDEIVGNYLQAIDAVRDPGSGRIVCRSTLTDPTNGCIPFNPMGTGVNSQAAVDYVTGTGWTHINLAQDVFSFSASGEPFSTWAGPVSVAFGVEHRKESVRTTASALDQARAFFAGNFTESRGKYNVTEGFVEVVAPLAEDLSWAKSIELNGAVRATDYSESGYVTTWKVGGTYKPISDITFRATRSRDIRAPNLGDLFNAGRSGTGTVTDPATGQTATIVTRVQGNVNLKPEKADTTGIGVVFQPSFLPGFGASVDYYDIKIKGAIVSLSAQQYVDRCFAGDTTLCSFIQRDANNVINFVAVQPANVLSQTARGIDFDASYSYPLSNLVSDWKGKLSFRGMATYVLSLKTIDEQTVVQGAGVNADSGAIGQGGLYAPHFRYLLSLTYDNDPFAVTVTARGVGPGKYNNSLIECATDCPVATPANRTINNNHIKGVTYFDLSMSYKLFDGTAELFFVTDNVFNTAPPLIAGGTGNGYYSGQASGDYYDQIGRAFRAGVRFKF